MQASPEHRAALERILQHEGRQLPWQHLVFLLLLTAGGQQELCLPPATDAARFQLSVVLAVSLSLLLRVPGEMTACSAACAAVIVSDTVKGSVKCGSVGYWAISLSLVPLIVAASAIIACWLVRKHAAKVVAHHQLQEGEVGPISQSGSNQEPRIGCRQHAHVSRTPVCSSTAADARQQPPHTAC